MSTIDSRVRRYVNCAFGILINKKRIFHHPIDFHTELATDILKWFIWHNFVHACDTVMDMILKIILLLQ